MDRRIKKTQILLKETLTTLIEQKELRNITVSELCELANINRGTFYLHYLDIYDMIEQFEKAIVGDLAAIIEKNSPISAEYYILPVLIQVIEYLYKDMRFVKAMLSKNGDLHFLEQLKTTMLAQTKKSLPEFPKKYDETFIKILTIFIVSGGAGVFQEWLNGDFQVPLKSIIYPCEIMITSGISKILGN
ncbi:MAG: TetR/AcrR family transcriptional regulator [Bacilli bacterium]